MPTIRRILFAEHDARVREALQRLVRPYAPAWEATFAPGGVEALRILKEASFDVLVTGMAMPVVTGGDLLRAVAEGHPGMVRIALAPASEQAHVMACAGHTHQYVARPCEGEVLFDAVNRACDMEASIRRERVGRLVGRMDRLPSLPDLYVKLVEKVQDPECSIDEIGDIVAQDIGMTARILKMVNSASFGLRRRVANPHEAVNFAGIDTVKSLVLSISAFAQYENLRLGGVTLEALWTHSLTTAGCAKMIAQAEGANMRTADEAFVAGMLHDIGKLALGANFAADYAAVVEGVAQTPGKILDAEQTAFGATHAEIGGYLLGLWGLPGAVVDAVAWHHDPIGCPEPVFGPLACVHAANVWAHEGDADGWLEIATEYFETLQKGDRVAEWRRTIVEADGTLASA